MQYHPNIRDAIMLHLNGGTNGFTADSITSEGCLAAIY
jgi:hypothetical protein